MAKTQDEAHKAFGRAQVSFVVNYPGAMEHRRKDWDKLLAFYDFPAEHRVHIRTASQCTALIANVLNLTGD